MHIDKTISLSASIEDVWNAVLDVEAIAGCFPGLELIEKIDENIYRSIVKVSVAHITAKFDLLTRITETKPPIYLATLTEGKSQTLGATVTQRQTLELKTLDAEITEVLYKGDVVVTGRLAMLGQRVIRAKAEQMADALASSFVALLQTRVAGIAETRRHGDRDV
ncbi:MAG: hypothetical protein HYY30_09360 [Chloroflexi bacterium]|nr:hypothetical protein [Chloroflexota bacterium]